MRNFMSGAAVMLLGVSVGFVAGTLYGVSLMRGNA